MRNRAALAVIAVTIATVSLKADVAIGAGAAILGTSLELGLAPAVFLIEAVIGYRIFRDLGGATPLVAVIIANIASSILGMVFAEFVPISFSFRRNFDAAMLAMLALCIPFFVLSVVIEYAVARRMMPSDYDSRAWRWAIEANLVSYLMIVAVLLIALWSSKSPRIQGLIFSIW